jgi:hypothetical protein
VTNRGKGKGMMPTRNSDRRVSGHRRWHGGLLVVAGLCSLALIAPATSAAKKPISASVSVDATCGFVEVSGEWTPVSGQAYVGIDLSDNQSGVSVPSALVPVASTATTETVDLGGSLSPLARGRHALKATFTVYDSSLNPLVSDKANASMPCYLDAVVLPT